MIRASVEGVGDGPLVYDITFENGNDLHVVVRKSLENLKDLNDALLAELDPAVDIIPDFPDNSPSPQQLELFLNHCLQSYFKNISIAEHFNGFMEDSSQQSAVTRLQFNVLKEKVKISYHNVLCQPVNNI